MLHPSVFFLHVPRFLTLTSVGTGVALAPLSMQDIHKLSPRSVLTDATPDELGVHYKLSPRSVLTDPAQDDLPVHYHTGKPTFTGWIGMFEFIVK